MARQLSGQGVEIEAAAAGAGATAPPVILPAYFGRALPRLGREVVRRLGYRQAHWRVGYRFIDGPGVAETGVLMAPRGRTPEVKTTPGGDPSKAPTADMTNNPDELPAGDAKPGAEGAAA